MLTMSKVCNIDIETKDVFFPLQSNSESRGAHASGFRNVNIPRPLDSVICDDACAPRNSAFDCKGKNTSLVSVSMLQILRESNSLVQTSLGITDKTRHMTQL